MIKELTSIQNNNKILSLILKICKVIIICPKCQENHLRVNLKYVQAKADKIYVKL